MKKNTMLFLSLFLSSMILHAFPPSFMNLFNKNGYQQCPPAEITSSPGFCASFRTSAACHCSSSGLPSGMCQDVNQIYNRMISIFGSIQKACNYQKDTTPQTCIDDWNCFRIGGRNSQGALCSGTGHTC